MFVFFQDVFYLQTPGGGGYGKEVEGHDQPERKRRKVDQVDVKLSKVGTGSVYDYQRAQESV